ncbi:MAG: glycine cleavage T C-terminal barrel domain-containing protein [Gemmatimonadaceae bacterium]|nr:glycine cleavage T C-terminal barrel domain-containing protein [Gemmatimonadaceae bacterium]
MTRETIAGTITPAHPALQTILGQPVVLTYSNVDAEYAALTQRAGVVDRSHRARVRVNGPKAAEMIAGLVTNDTLALPPGQGQYAAALSPKGKIIADVRIFVQDKSVLTDTGARAADGWRTMLKKYVNPRVAPHVDESATTRALGVFGPTARHVIETMTGVNSSALTLLPAYAHVQVEVDGAVMMIARTPELLVDGFELFAPTDAFDALWGRATRAGAEPCGLSAWEVARVEAGRPEWGLDMDDTTLTQEANFDELQAISYTKGCYVGQEVVARVHFKGHVNRHLRGLRAPETAAPPPGATLVDPAGSDVGDVRTSVKSPRLGSIALGMVRREVELGATLTTRWDGGEGRVEVCALPFPPA